LPRHPTRIAKASDVSLEGEDVLLSVAEIYETDDLIKLDEIGDPVFVRRRDEILRSMEQSKPTERCQGQQAALARRSPTPCKNWPPPCSPSLTAIGVRRRFFLPLLQITRCPGRGARIRDPPGRRSRYTPCRFQENTMMRIQSACALVVMLRA
jgi:hypothetical protein